MREVLKELKLPSDILKGLDQELAVPQAWIDGARKEGVVRITMLSEEAAFDRLWKVFSARYPGLKYEYTHGIGARRALQPLLAFRRGNYITDVVASFQVLEEEYRKADSLLDVVKLLPAARSVRPEHNSEHGIGVAYRLINFCMAYNTKAVKKAELPKTWEEFIESPRWRNGKVGMATNANAWLVELWGQKGDAWGRDYVRRIFADMKPQLRKENLTMIGRLAGLGEFEIAIPTSDAATWRNARQGNPVAFHCPDVVPISVVWLGVLKGSPRVNGALLFANWMVSKEGQIATHWADGQTPANAGLAGREFLHYPEEVLGKKTAPLTGATLREMPRMMAFWEEHWNKAGGPGSSTEGGDAKGAKKGAPR
jgi:iron(III) transport system substrate-binding protein